MAYAHSRNLAGERQGLVEHLVAVAEQAALFARDLGAVEAARLLGLCHDAGKFSAGFQQYLLEAEANPNERRRGPDHKAAGSFLARRLGGLLALLVQAHHGGLRSPAELQSWLAERSNEPDVAEAIANAQAAVADLVASTTVPLPRFGTTNPLGADLFLRLLFSALVDADFLDTEAHFQAGRAVLRGTEMKVADLWERLEANQSELCGKRTDPVAVARDAVYQACLKAAEEPPGLFRLSVPTGGGKTRSGLAFALRHALRYGQRRVVVAVPFISITEQTADVYRTIFGQSDDAKPAVLEHHSGVVDSDEDEGTSGLWRRLAAENWDAPIIVTTTVQLFESLFASATSRARKLHRLARSVIILDEAQALPAHLLQPILDVLQRLCQDYGATVVLSTATQPAFDTIPVFANLAAREIVPNPERLFATLKRVDYEWRTDDQSNWAQVGALLRESDQALAVLNTKKDALDLLAALNDPDALHLSTLLCGAHRRKVIAEVQRRLRSEERCRLVSTQVVEAGVDLDFPLVVRALGPLDAIIQAAGRCNREGRLERGRFVVVDPAGGGLPMGAYRIGAGVTRALLGVGSLDPHDPATARTYFQRYLQTLGPLGTDREAIQALRGRLDFPAVAAAFRMIDDDTESVVVPYGTAAERRAVTSDVARLREGVSESRLILRRLQPYVVTLRRRGAEKQRRQGTILPVIGDLGEWWGDYDPVTGLGIGSPDPERLVV